MQAKPAFEKLSLMVGERWDVGRELEREVVVVEATAIAVPDLKARLAKVGGEWRHIEGRETLVRPKKLVETWRNVAIAKRAEAVKKVLDEQYKAMPAWSETEMNRAITFIAKKAEVAAHAGPTTISEARGDLNRSGSNSPCGRALTKLLHEILPTTIAAIATDDLRFFSNPPTKIELPLGRSSDQVLRDFNAEQRAFNLAVAERKDLYPAVDYLDPRFNSTPDDEPAVRLVLQIRRHAVGFYILSLQAADKTGAVVGRASQDLVIYPPATQRVRVDSEAEIKYSDRALSWDQLYMRRSGRYGGFEKLDELPLIVSWQKVLVDQKTNEPLSFSVEEELRQVAKAQNLNLVADLPDELLATIPQSPLGGKRKISELMDRLQGSFTNCLLSISDGWLEAEPVDKARATENRLSRELFSDLAGCVYSRKGITLDTLAKYAFEQTSILTFEGADAVYARLFEPSDREGVADQAAGYFRTLLRLWGSLSPAQRSSLRDGGSFQFGDLSLPSRHYIDQLIYGIKQAFSLVVESPYTVDPSSTQRRNIKELPQEGLPNGLDLGCTIRGERLNDPLFGFTTEEGEFHSGVASSIAWYVATEKLQPERLQFKTARRGGIKLLFDLGNRFTAHAELHDDPTEWSKEAAYEALQKTDRDPLELEIKKVRARIAEEEERAKKQTIPPFAAR